MVVKKKKLKKAKRKSPAQRLLEALKAGRAITKILAKIKKAVSKRARRKK
jgi:hypothetical protein